MTQSLGVRQIICKMASTSVQHVPLGSEGHQLMLPSVLADPVHFGSDLLRWAALDPDADLVPDPAQTNYSRICQLNIYF
jgi:hypothetical protein